MTVPQKYESLPFHREKGKLQKLKFDKEILFYRIVSTLVFFKDVSHYMLCRFSKNTIRSSSLL